MPLQQKYKENIFKPKETLLTEAKIKFKKKSEYTHLNQATSIQGA